MKVGWSIQRHVSVKGLVELLQMLSSGEPVDALEASYYARMSHSYTLRSKHEEIFARNVQFLQYYLEVLDEKRALRKEFRNMVQSIESAGLFLYNRSLKNILAFRVLVDLASRGIKMETHELQRALAEALLTKAAQECPDEYAKKVKQLRAKYGSERSWVYPHASLDRLNEILKLAPLSEHAPSSETKKEELAVFRERVRELYYQMVKESGQQIISIDAFKNRYMAKWPTSGEDFDDSFRSMLDSDPSILDFSGKMGNEVGLVKKSGKHVYRFMIQE